VDWEPPQNPGRFNGKPHGILALAIADLTAGGIPAADALASATSLAAQACGLANFKGRLHPGYDADLAIVDGDPLTDIAALTAVQAVYLGGQAAPPAPLTPLADVGRSGVPPRRVSTTGRKPQATRGNRSYRMPDLRRRRSDSPRVAGDADRLRARPSLHVAPVPAVARCHRACHADGLSGWGAADEVAVLVHGPG
jgi:hypothetical protein